MINWNEQTFNHHKFVEHIAKKRVFSLQHSNISFFHISTNVRYDVLFAYAVNLIRADRDQFPTQQDTANCNQMIDKLACSGCEDGGKIADKNSRQTFFSSHNDIRALPFTMTNQIVLGCCKWEWRKIAPITWCLAGNLTSDFPVVFLLVKEMSFHCKSIHVSPRMMATKGRAPN